MVVRNVGKKAVRNVHFSEKLACFGFFLNTRFEIRPFALLPTKWTIKAFHKPKSQIYFPNLLWYLSINLTNWSNTLKQFVGCDHFVWLALKWLRQLRKMEFFIRTTSNSYFWFWGRKLFIYLSKQESTFSLKFKQN